MRRSYIYFHINYDDGIWVRKGRLTLNTKKMFFDEQVISYSLCFRIDTLFYEMCLTTIKKFYQDIKKRRYFA